MQDLIGQQHPGGFATDLACTNAMFQHVIKIRGGKPLPGNVNECQLVANGAFKQHDPQFLQLVVDRATLVIGQGFIFLGLSQYHFQRGKFRVETQA